jgi:hypothetical protein
LAIFRSEFAVVGTAGGSGGSSDSVSWRFARPVTISAQTAISGYGGVDPTGEVGFSAFVQDGIFNPIGGEGYGSWAKVLFAPRVTQVDISARSYSSWVQGSAVAFLWD